MTISHLCKISIENLATLCLSTPTMAKVQVWLFKTDFAFIQFLGKLILEIDDSIHELLYDQRRYFNICK